MIVFDRLRAGSRPADEQGFTLVELLVVVVLLGVVGSVALAGIVTAFRTSTNAQERVATLTELETATQRMSREIRMADPVLTSPAPAANALAVAVYRGSGRMTFTYAAAGGVLTETRRTFATPTAATPISTVTTELATDLDLDPSDPTFAYRKADDSDWVSGTDAIGELAEVTIRLNGVHGTGGTTEVRTAVFLRNVRDGRY